MGWSLWEADFTQKFVGGKAGLTGTKVEIGEGDHPLAIEAGGDDLGIIDEQGQGGIGSWGGVDQVAYQGAAVAYRRPANLPAGITRAGYSFREASEHRCV
jgi:hypothetical protein